MTLKFTKLAIALSIVIFAQNTIAADDDLDRAIAESLQDQFKREAQQQEAWENSDFEEMKKFEDIRLENHQNIIYKEQEIEIQENLFAGLLINVSDNIKARDYAFAIMLINSFLSIKNLNPLLSRQAQDMAATLELDLSTPYSNPEIEERAPQPIPVSSPSHLPEQALKEEQEEDLFFRLTNKARREANPLIPLLTKNLQLTEAARKHSANMAAHRIFSHEIDGKTVGDRTKAEGYNGLMVGENLYTCEPAFSYSENGIDYSTVRYSSMQKAVDALMDSPGHRENILRPEFNELGVGIAMSPFGIKYWTQVFGTKP